MIVGLQGSGKTTSTGKLARWLSKNGQPAAAWCRWTSTVRRRGSNCACWPSESDVPIYEGKPEETKPLELAKGAKREADQTGRDIVLVDTAGRLHIDEDLMTELERAQEQRSNPTEILFVADAMTGQDAVKSADEFHKRLGITGVVLTKMDGDARGGGALSIRHSHRPAAQVRRHRAKSPTRSSRSIPTASPRASSAWATC